MNDYFYSDLESAVIALSVACKTYVRYSSLTTDVI